ncbi:MAG: hypothetical protein KGH60_01905 [Candidatus Micrarchaeota archaeon]|nr:hypothetical protein [Candidatus Micrarchaeota archaeon]
MPEVVELKVRRIGTSLGVIIPKRIIAEEHLKEGSKVSVALLKKERLKLVERAFGIAKGAKPFKREYEEDRF